MRYAEQNNKLPDRYKYLNSDLPPEVRLIRQHQAIAQKRKMKNDIEKQTRILYMTYQKSMRLCQLNWTVFRTPQRK